ncbi:MAG: molybdenum cofactor synthesis domain-containing protein [Bacteroidota bacterium]
MNIPSEQEIEILSVNISEKKGVIKSPVPEIILDERGVRGDAHAGDWHRQVSLLGTESIAKFSLDAAMEIVPGEFAENLTTKGMALYHTSPFDLFVCGDIILEVTQIGKKCHGDNCAIYREVGNCVMPKEGIFCKVIQGGTLKAGDKLQYKPKLYRALVITLSDRASRGEYEDKSGPTLVKELTAYFDTQHWHHKIETHVIPDDPELLTNLCIMGESEGFDFIFTTGGTGIGPRDITPDVIRPLIDKEIPGIMDHIRWKYGQNKPNALVSRAIAGTMSESLVFCLPGSVNAVKEYFSEIAPSLKHLVHMIHGLDNH